MKFAIVLLVLLPLALSNPLEKRFLLDTLLEGPEVKNIVDQLVASIGAEATEKACEAECHVLIKADHIMQFGCPMLCRSFQSLVLRFGHVTTTPSA